MDKEMKELLRQRKKLAERAGKEIIKIRRDKDEKI